MRLEKYTVSTFDSPFKLGLYLPFHASLESNQRSLSRHNFHVLTFIRSIVSHFVYLSCRYRSREHEVEDDEYKKDASDCFVPHSFSSDVSRASGLDDEKSCNWGSQGERSVAKTKRRDTVSNRTEVGYRLEKIIDWSLKSEQKG
jgi:hypothetical protein